MRGRKIFTCLVAALIAVTMTCPVTLAAGKTGIYKTKGVYRYYKKGKIQYHYTGVATRKKSPMKGTWYFKNGKIAKKYSGKKTIRGYKYTIKKGKVVKKVRVTPKQVREAKEELASAKKQYYAARDLIAAMDANKTAYQSSRKAWETQQLKYNSVTFFRWIEDNYSDYKQDAKNAIEILQNIQYHDAVDFHNIDDAVSIENMKYIVPLYYRYIAIRKTDPDVNQSVVPKLSLEAIASAQANADRSRKNQGISHALQDGYLENLTRTGWSCDVENPSEMERTPDALTADAFENWYDDEKEAKGGHYKQIIADHITTGFGVGYYTRNYTSHYMRNYVAAQEFGDNKNGKMSYKKLNTDGKTTSVSLTETPISVEKFYEMYTKYYDATGIKAYKKKMQETYKTYASISRYEYEEAVACLPFYKDQLKAAQTRYKKAVKKYGK